MKPQSEYIKFALPKGRFLSSTANLLNEITVNFRGYTSKTRQYRLQSTNFPYLLAKIFHEKDIPIQVAMGNYDLGICGLDWIEELLTRYPASDLMKISNLNYGEGNIYAATSCQTGISSVDELLAKRSSWRIISEYPNLAQSFALNLRVKDFNIFPVWGAAEVYPPEDANLAILWAKDEKAIEAQGLKPLGKLLSVNASLIANRESLENKDLSKILSCFNSVPVNNNRATVSASEGIVKNEVVKKFRWQSGKIRLALPDGHQQLPAAEFLKRVGLNIQGYADGVLNRRPSANLDWLGIKVIRPQDMPLQVANGNFDLAITGNDWLLEHLNRFPSSPAMKLLDLLFGKVKIVAAVSKDMPVANIEDLRLLMRGGKLASLRVASEYINLADKYLRDNYINPYKLIPTWGASEAFLPEDADLLIDNVQTGRTLAQHKLKIIDVLFESTACLIGNRNALSSPDKKVKTGFFIQTLRKGLL